jgi:hypothetical protein
MARKATKKKTKKKSTKTLNLGPIAIGANPKKS